MDFVTQKETPSVGGKDKTRYLQFGNIKLNNLLLRLHYQEEDKPEPASNVVKVTTANITYQQCLRFSERETEDKQEKYKV